MPPPHETLYFLTGGTGPRPTTGTAFLATAAQRTAKTKELRRLSEERRVAVREEKVRREKALKEVGGGVGVMWLFGRGRGVEVALRGGDKGRGGGGFVRGRVGGKDDGCCGPEAVDDGVRSVDVEGNVEKKSIVAACPEVGAGIDVDTGDEDITAVGTEPHHADGQDVSNQGLEESPAEEIIQSQDDKAQSHHKAAAGEIPTPTIKIMGSDRSNGENISVNTDRSFALEEPQVSPSHGRHLRPQSSASSNVKRLLNNPRSTKLELERDISADDIRPSIITPSTDPDNNCGGVGKEPPNPSSSFTDIPSQDSGVGVLTQGANDPLSPTPHLSHPREAAASAQPSVRLDSRAPRNARGPSSPTPHLPPPEKTNPSSQPPPELGRIRTPQSVARDQSSPPPHLPPPWDNSPRPTALFPPIPLPPLPRTNTSTLFPPIPLPPLPRTNTTTLSSTPPRCTSPDPHNAREMFTSIPQLSPPWEERSPAARSASARPASTAELDVAELDAAVPHRRDPLSPTPAMLETGEDTKEDNQRPQRGKSSMKSRSATRFPFRHLKDISSRSSSSSRYTEDIMPSNFFVTDASSATSSLRSGAATPEVFHIPPPPRSGAVTPEIFHIHPPASRNSSRATRFPSPQRDVVTTTASLPSPPFQVVSKPVVSPQTSPSPMRTRTQTQTQRYDDDELTPSLPGRFVSREVDGSRKTVEEGMSESGGEVGMGERTRRETGRWVRSGEGVWERVFG